MMGCPRAGALNSDCARTSLILRETLAHFEESPVLTEAVFKQEMDLPMERHARGAAESATAR